jgi:vacuolar-type H+-ATPase subunit I/STV1
MVSFETIVIGVILVVLGIVFFYVENYFTERIVQIALIVIGIIFLIVGVYYIAMGLIPGQGLVVDD